MVYLFTVFLFFVSWLCSTVLHTLSAWECLLPTMNFEVAENLMMQYEWKNEWNIWVTRKMPGLIRPMSHWKWVQNNGKYTGYRFKSWVLVLYMLYKCFPILIQIGQFCLPNHLPRLDILIHKGKAKCRTFSHKKEVLLTNMVGRPQSVHYGTMVLF